MFFDNMWIAARQVLVLYLIVAVGFAVDRLGVFKQKTAQHSNDLLFFITTPATIIHKRLGGRSFKGVFAYEPYNNCGNHNRTAVF